MHIRSAIVFIAMLSVLPASAAAQRQRATRPTSSIVVEAVVSGVVTDATTGSPVIGAEVVSGKKIVLTNTTGRFELKLIAGNPATITAQRTGYTAQVKTLTPTGNSTLNFTLQGKPTVMIRETSGTTHQVDLETAQFAYLVTFSGYVKADKTNLCKPDGTSFTPDKSEIARFIGPGVSTNHAACCPNAPVISANIEMKSGEKTLAYFADSCTGFPIDFVGRDHLTAQWHYIRVTNIAEIVIP